MNIDPGPGVPEETDARDGNPKDKKGSICSGASFQALINRIQQGDRLALQELLQSCRDYLLLIANQEMDRDLHRKLGPSDIVQNTMLAAHQHVAEFRGVRRKQFLAWIRQILLRDMNRARREMRGAAKRDMRRERPLDGDSRVGNLPIDIRDPEFTPQARAVCDEEKKLLDQALERLAENHRQIIFLRNSEQLSFKEIGERLNRSPGAAQKLWTRAIERLKTELKALNVL